MTKDHKIARMIEPNLVRPSAQPWAILASFVYLPLLQVSNYTKRYKLEYSGDSGKPTGFDRSLSSDNVSCTCTLENVLRNQS